MKFSDNEKLAFSAMVDLQPSTYRGDFRFRIFVVNADGSALSRVDHLGDQKPSTATFCQQPRWSMDGLYLYYEVWKWAGSRYEESYYRVSVVDNTVIEVTRESYDSTPRNVSESDVSPDGQLTIFLREDSDYGFILSSLKDETLCAEELKNVYGFTWSPDSSAILFFANDKEDQTKSDLWLLDTGSQNCLLVLNNCGPDSSCTWSPDCMHFVATAHVTEPAWGYGFYLINRDEARCQHLVNHVDSTGEILPSRPAWSIDGRSLAISARPSDDSPDFKLYVFNNKGELRHELSWRDEHFSRIDDIVWKPLK